MAAHEAAANGGGGLYPSESDSSHIPSSHSLATAAGDDNTATRIAATAGSAEATESTALLQGGPKKDSWVGAEDFAGLPWWKTPSVFWLLGPYFLFTVAFGGSLVPRLNLIVDLVCRKYFSDREKELDSLLSPSVGGTLPPNTSPAPHYPHFPPVVLGADNPQCVDPNVQRSVAEFTLALSVISGVLSAVTAPKLGSLSDRYGRTRIMVAVSAGGVVAEVIVILCGQFPDIVDYRWMMLGTFVDGLLGSYTAGSIMSHSYVSDCTPPSRRAVAVGYLHSCLFTGLALGPLLAGYFVRWMGNLLSIFYVALGCHIFFILFVLFVTPESLSRKRQLMARDRFREESESGLAGAMRRSGRNAWLASLISANPFAPLRILWPPSSAPASAGAGRGRRSATSALRRNLIVLAAVDTVIIGAAMSSMTVIILYCERQFGWGTLESSKLISLTSFMRVFVLAVIFPLVNHVMRTRPAARRRLAAGDAYVPQVESNRGADELDLWILTIALVSDVIGAVGYILVRTSQLFVACAVVTAFGGLGSATIQSVITKHVPTDQVGALLGAIGLLHALARVFAPILFNGLYAATVASFPQAIFVLLSSLFVLALMASMLLRPHVYLGDSSLPPPAVPPPRTVDDESDSDAEEAIAEEDLLRVM